MEKVRQHLQHELDTADKAYWDTYHRHEEKKKELTQLQHDVIWLGKDLEKQDADRKYYMGLLNDLDSKNGNNS